MRLLFACFVVLALTRGAFGSEDLFDVPASEAAAAINDQLELTHPKLLRDEDRRELTKHPEPPEATQPANTVRCRRSGKGLRCRSGVTHRDEEHDEAPDVAQEPDTGGEHVGDTVDSGGVAAGIGLIVVTVTMGYVEKRRRKRVAATRTENFGN